MKGRATLIFLVAVHVAVVAAGFLAPYDYAEMHREFSYYPPTGIHWINRGGHVHLRPFVRGEDGTESSLRFFVHGRLFGVDEPGVIFLFGSDGFGRDVFSRVLYGARISLLTGLIAAMISLGIGATIGTVAGFFGGLTDQVLMRTGELVMALPWIYLLLGVRAFLPLHIGAWQAFLLVIVIIGVAGWVRPARLIRGVVLSAKERPYVQAARGFGASDFYLIRRHILPFTVGVLLTQATILIPQYILAEVTLSFLGLGVGEPVPSWGNMLAAARQYHAIISHPWLLAPGIAAVPILLGYLRMADSLHQDT